MNDALRDERTDYDHGQLSQSDVGSDPLGLAAGWIESAGRHADILESNAMALATVAADGTPSVRYMLLKGIDPPRAAFSWYTSLTGRKAVELAASGRAAIAMWWPKTHRQIRVVGCVHQIDRLSTDSYFHSRPLLSQVSATASSQSTPIASRAELDARFEAAGSQAASAAEMPTPNHWGGFELIADEIELWNGRPSRRHDRILCVRATTPRGIELAADPAGTSIMDPHGTTWIRTRLQP